MSWLYSQVLVAGFLEENCLDGKQCVQSSGNPTPQAYCAPDKMTDFSRLSRFGMTFKPLTENLGEELLTWYLAGFHVKTSQPQEKEQALTVSDQECGQKWRGSFTKYDPDSCSWKTHQCSFLGGLDEFSETWPQWGLMRDGECWEQQTLEHRIRGIESGLSGKIPTPIASPGGAGKNIDNKRGVYQGNPLATWVATQERKKWPTPTVSDHKGSGPTMMRSDGKMRGDRLDYATERNTDGTSTGGQLNPTWVEWLMGWPLGWTDLKPLETDKSHSVQQKHSEFYQETFKE